MKRHLICLTTLLVGSFSVFAQHTEFFNFPGVNLDIPDGDPVGVVSQQTLATGIDTITDVKVTVNITGTTDVDPTSYNGDLYMYLQHESGIAILMNRVGKTLSRLQGYDDEGGFDITFDDAAANDVHLYQDFVPVPGVLPLLGTWQPDGRFIDPDIVLDTDPRNAMLGSFAALNLDADGEWNLYMADLFGGSEHTLNSWSLEITGIPEPATVSLLAIGGIALLRRRRSILIQ